MDHVDKSALMQSILEYVYKYDDEGRRCCLTAEEAVAYAKTITNFIEGEANGN